MSPFPGADRPIGAMYNELRELRAQGQQAQPAATASSALTPADQADRSLNPLRPRAFSEVVGQDGAKELVQAAIRYARQRGEPLPHMLLVGPAGTGKSTFAHVVASALGAHVYQLAAPVSFDTLLRLREVMGDRDVLFVDEIHLQAIQERRGRESITTPEVLYGVLEDRVIATASGVLPYPAITMIGGTTDEGMLSDAFLSRFPLRPRLVEYTVEDLAVIARRNARTLGASLTASAAVLFGVAARGTPREVNNLVRNAIIFTHAINERTARETLRRSGVEEQDGLTADMAELLRFVYRTGRVQLRSGEVRYQSSVSSIAVGIGKSRDTKAVVLRIEPWLIRCGYMQIVAGSGRRLTDAGIERARELSERRAAQAAAPDTREDCADRAMQILGL